MSKKNAYRVAVAGATGLVGETILQILAERKFPVSELIPLASARSVGKTIEFDGRKLPVRDLASFDFAGVDIGLFSAGGSVSGEHAPRAGAAGCVVIDNTRTFAATPTFADVPGESAGDSAVPAAQYHCQSELLDPDGCGAETDSRCVGMPVSMSPLPISGPAAVGRSAGNRPPSTEPPG
jgi:N-acetyl-gamma-glutamylphosphate reductase